MQLSVRPTAVADVEAAWLWYESRSEGLGARFVEATIECLTAIRANPRRFRVAHRNARMALLRRFPYHVMYTIHDDRVVVHAIVHAHRDPQTLPREGADPT